VAEGAEDFMSYCHFMCSDFKLHGMSTFWDGNTQLVTKILMVIFNFLRKKNLFPQSQVKQLEKILELELINDLTFADQKEAENKPVKTKKVAAKPLMSIDVVKKQLRSVQEALGKGFLGSQERSLSDAPVNSSLNENNFDQFIAQLKDIHSDVIKLNEQDSSEDFKQQSLSSASHSNQKAVKSTRKQRKAKATAGTQSTKNIAATNDNPPAAPFGNANSAGPISSFIKKKKTKTTKHKKTHHGSKHNTERELSNNSPNVQSNSSPEAKTSQETESLPEQRKLEETTSVVPSERKLFLNEYNGTERYHSQIFEKRVTPVDVSCMRTFYTARTGALNPIRDLNYSNFKEIDPKHIIINKYKTYKYESLRPETLMGYLDADANIVRGFNSDWEEMDFKLMVGNPEEKQSLMETKVQAAKPNTEEIPESSIPSRNQSPMSRVVDITDEDFHMKTDSSHDTFTMIENTFFHKS
jgi:hypothetical protein